MPCWLGDMIVVIARRWWVLLLRGIAALLFGAIALLLPTVALEVLIVLFAAYAFIDGAFALGHAISAAEHRRRWWPLALEGVVGVAIAAVAVLWPNVTALALLYVVAFWALATGALELIAAIRVPASMPGRWLLFAAGGFSVLIGLWLLLSPHGVIALVRLLGIYGLIFGALLVAGSLALRRWPRRGLFEVVV